MSKTKAVFTRESVIAPSTDETRELYDQGRFGELQGEKFQYSLVEGLFLLEKKKLDIYDSKNQKFISDSYVKKATKLNKWNIHRSIIRKF